MGWTVGRNLRIDTVGAPRDPERLRRQAAGIGRARRRTSYCRWQAEPRRRVQQATRTVPIVFAQSIDPVGAGFVASLARPGGNVTGFTQFEYSLSGEMAGAAQGDRARRDARGRASRSGVASAGSGSGLSSRPWQSTIGVELSSDFNSRRQRDRARRRRIRARLEWRPDRDASSSATIHREAIIASSQPGTACRRSIRFATSSPPAA